MATLHNEAHESHIAKIVLMSGDPLRAKHFAETYLENIQQVNSVRGMLAFTGTYNGKEITVMGHGMGLESIGIYAYELYNHYDVDVIIRFGSCGSYNPNIHLFDVIIASESYSDSNFGEGYGHIDDRICGNKELINIANKVAEKYKGNHKIIDTTVYSSMWFYKTHNIDDPEWFVKEGIDVVEMETYALYAIANSLNKKALAILTVSDQIVNDERATPEERRIGFSDMFKILLKITEKITN